MALVAYEDSDCDSDEDNQITSTVFSSANDIHVKTKVDIKSFLTLPQPKNNLNEKVSDDFDSTEKDKKAKRPFVNSTQIKKEELSLFPTLPKPKAGGKVKIIIPSLNDVCILKKNFNN